MQHSDDRPANPGPTADTVSVDRKMAKGAVWMVLARGVDRSIGFASTIILARLLLPEDFGLVAMATAIMALLELFTSFGFDVALIRNSAATRKHYDTAWTFNVLFGFLIAVALLLVAGPASEFYDEPRLHPLISFLALGSAIQGFENIGVVSFRKDLRFRSDFNLTLLKKVCGFAITVPLAYFLRNYWVLVIGSLATRVMGVALTYLVHEYRPRFSLAARGELFHFGKWLVLSNAAYLAGTRSADFIIGKLAGAHQLGVFNISYETSNLPTSDLIAPINRAIFPGYARKAHDLDLLRRSYLEVIGLIALIAVPAGMGIAAVAQLLVPLLLGAKWIEAAPVMTILAFYGVFLALKSNNHYVYLAMGQPRLATVLGLIQMALLMPLAIVGSLRHGAIGAAIGYLCAQAVFTPFSVGLLRHVLRLRMFDLVRVLYRPMIAGGLMYLIVRALVQGWSVDPYSAATLVLPTVVCVAVGVGVYCGAVGALWRLAGLPDSAERHAIEFLESRLPARLRIVTKHKLARREGGDSIQ